MQRMLAPWRNHALGENVLRMELSEETRGIDHDALRTLRAKGLASLRPGKRVSNIGSSDDARRMFREFLEQPGLSHLPR